MNYCIHLKKRKNKPYCNIIKKEISLSQCRECVNKEYKKCTKFTKSSAKSVVKDTNMCSKSAVTQNFMQCSAESNCDQIMKKSTLYRKRPIKSGTMKNKSNKLVKMERDRFSVFTDKDKCFICDSKYQLTWNEIYRGRNRRNSMKYGFCLRMCLSCHEKYQEDILFNKYWHTIGQEYFENNIGTREDFINIFRKNYLD